jgi:hypothetical protein
MTFKTLKMLRGGLVLALLTGFSAPTFAAESPITDSTVPAVSVRRKSDRCIDGAGLCKYLFPLGGISVSDGQILNANLGVIVSPQIEHFAIGPVVELEPGVAGTQAGVGLGAHLYMGSHTPIFAGIRVKGIVMYQWLGPWEGGPFSLPERGSYSGGEFVASILVMRAAFTFLQHPGREPLWIGSLGIGL